MGVDDEFAGIAPRTFSLMRSRMVVNEAEATAFDKTLAKAVEAKVLRGPLTAIIDSSPVRGAGAVADTYELIRGFLTKAVRAAGQRLAEATRASAEPFCGAKPDIGWGDPAARKAHLAELVGAARAVVDELADVASPAVAEPVDLLAQVVAQDVDDDEEGRPQIRQGVAPDRIVSHSDPEMRHGRKSASRRFDGHKMDVVTDEDSELVLGVDVRPGNAADGEGAAPLLAHILQIPGIAITTLLADMAYSDGDVREEVEELGAEVMAKVPPVTNGGRYPKTDFSIEPDEVTCPAGEVTRDTRLTTDRKGRPAVTFVFPASVCGGCPLRAECVGGQGGRTITVGIHEERIAAARVAQTEPETKALLRRRAKVERKIDHLQDLGMAKARYRGRRKTKLQLYLAATVANFKRLCVLDAFAADPEVACAA
jgi:DDE family transposase